MILLLIPLALGVVISCELLSIRNRRLVWVLDRLAEVTRRRLPIGAALEAMSVDAPRRMGMRLLRAGVDVQAGSTVGAAMAGHPKIFPAALARFVAAAEAAGRLEPLLQRLPGSVRRRTGSDRAAALLLLYPCFLLMLPSVVGLMIPGFSRAWMQLGFTPRMTQFVPFASVALAAIVGAASLFLLARHSFRFLEFLPKTRRWRDESLAMTCDLTALLLSSGMPPDRALRLAAEAADSRAARRLAGSLERGEPPADAVAATGWPAPVCELLAAGARAGRWADAFEDAAAWLRGRLENAPDPVKRVVVLLVLLAGTMIGAVYLEIMMIPWDIGENIARMTP